MCRPSSSPTSRNSCIQAPEATRKASRLLAGFESGGINFGRACPVTDLFGVEGRRLLERLQVPEPWRGNVATSVLLIDDLERQISEANCRLKDGHADHPYIPLLMTAPGIGWVLAFVIAAEIGAIERFPSPQKLTGYTGLCPRVDRSGEKDRHGPLTKHGPRYVRWALLEATMHALKHPAYAERYQHNKRRLGKQRGPKVAQIDIARRLTHAIWHMLSRNQEFAPRGAVRKRGRRRPLLPLVDEEQARSLTVLLLGESSTLRPTEYVQLEAASEREAAVARPESAAHGTC